MRTVACSAGGGALGWVALGSVAAAFGCLAGGVFAWWLGTLEPAALVRERAAVTRDLPTAAELLAACTLVGAPLERAVVIVAEALGGPLADRLRRVVLQLELGSDPVSVWRRMGEEPELASLARTLVRALESGAPPADGLTRLAADRRRDQRAEQQSKARAVGVKSAGPLAGCFLPAFMLIGVVPMVVGVFAQLGF